MAPPPTRSQARRTTVPFAPLAMLALLAAAALAAAPPQAGEPGKKAERAETPRETVVLAPDPVRRGEHIELRIDVCEGESAAVARAAVFESDVTMLTQAHGGLAGSATVRADAAPGLYTVIADCGNKRRAARGTFTVVTGHRPVSPSAPVRAGGGGTADEAGAETGGGGFTAGGGAVLGLAAATALGATALHRRRRRTAGVPRGTAGSDGPGGPAASGGPAGGGGDPGDPDGPGAPGSWGGPRGPGSSGGPRGRGSSGDA